MYVRIPPMDFILQARSLDPHPFHATQMQSLGGVRPDRTALRETELECLSRLRIFSQFTAAHSFDRQEAAELARRMTPGNRAAYAHKTREERKNSSPLQEMP